MEKKFSKKRIFAKLRSAHGMSLAETLLCVLLLGLLSSAVATGVVSAGRVYQESKMYTSAQILANTVLQEITNEIRYDRPTSTDGVFCPANSENTVSYAIDTDGMLTVTYGTGSTISLFGDGTYSGLKLKLIDDTTPTLLIKYDATNNCALVNFKVVSASGSERTFVEIKDVAVALLNTSLSAGGSGGGVDSPFQKITDSASSWPDFITTFSIIQGNVYEYEGKIYVAPATYAFSQWWTNTPIECNAILVTENPRLLTKYDKKDSGNGSGPKDDLEDLKRGDIYQTDEGDLYIRVVDSDWGQDPLTDRDTTRWVKINIPSLP